MSLETASGACSPPETSGNDGGSMPQLGVLASGVQRSFIDKFVNGFLCPICFEAPGTVVLPCSHHFCRQCLDSTFKEQSKSTRLRNKRICPYCSQELPDQIEFSEMPLLNELFREGNEILEGTYCASRREDPVLGANCGVNERELIALSTYQLRQAATVLRSVADCRPKAGSARQISLDHQLGIPLIQDNPEQPQLPEPLEYDVSSHLWGAGLSCPDGKPAAEFCSQCLALVCDECRSVPCPSTGGGYHNFRPLAELPQCLLDAAHDTQDMLGGCIRDLSLAQQPLRRLTSALSTYITQESNAIRLASNTVGLVGELQRNSLHITEIPTGDRDIRVNWIYSTIAASLRRVWIASSRQFPSGIENFLVIDSLARRARLLMTPDTTQVSWGPGLLRATQFLQTELDPAIMLGINAPVVTPQLDGVLLRRDVHAFTSRVDFSDPRNEGTFGNPLGVTPPICTQFSVVASRADASAVSQLQADSVTVNPALYAFCSYLPAAAGIQGLSIAKAPLSGFADCALFRDCLLPLSRHLLYLRITNCELLSPCLEIIAAPIAEAQQLVALDLSGNRLSDQAMDSLIFILRRLPNLRVVDISSNAFTDQFFTDFMDLIRTRPLVSLSVANNYIVTPKSARLLLTLAQQSTTLRHLDVSSNNWSAHYRKEFEKIDKDDLKVIV